MMKKLLGILVSLVQDECGIEDIYEVDRIRYGLEILLNEVSKIIIIFFISLFLGKTKEFFLLSVLLITIRTKIGEGHCKSYYGCLIKSICMYLLLYFLSAFIGEVSYLIKAIIFCIIMIIFLKVEYKTRSGTITDKKEIVKFRLKLIVTYVIICMVTRVFNSYIYTNIVLLFSVYIIFQFGMGKVKR